PARWHRAPDARIVDEDVDPAELPCRRIDQGLAFLGHPYVGAPNEYVCPARPELEGQLVEPLLTPGSEDQRGTHGCEGPSESHPEPGARAGDKHHPVVETERIEGIRHGMTSPFGRYWTVARAISTYRLAMVWASIEPSGRNQPATPWHIERIARLHSAGYRL